MLLLQGSAYWDGWNNIKLFKFTLLHFFKVLFLTRPPHLKIFVLSQSEHSLVLTTTLYDSVVLTHLRVQNTSGAKLIPSSHHCQRICSSGQTHAELLRRVAAAQNRCHPAVFLTVCSCWQLLYLSVNDWGQIQWPLSHTPALFHRGNSNSLQPTWAKVRVIAAQWLSLCWHQWATGSQTLFTLWLPTAQFLSSRLKLFVAIPQQ